MNTKEEKGDFVYQKLTAAAAASQPAVKQTLLSSGAEFRSFWITNAIWAKGSLAAIQAVATQPEVAYVFESGGGSLRLPPQQTVVGGAESALLADPAPEPEEAAEEIID